MDDTASNRPASPRRDLRLLLPSSARWHEFRETLAALLAPAPVRIASRPEAPVANPRAQACSLALHAGMIALLLIPAYYNGGDPPGIKPPGGPGWMILPGDWQKEITPQPPKGGGTGGERNPIPHTRGMLPRFDRWQIAPPRVTIPESARLQVEASLVGWPEIQPPNISAANFGDPTKQLLTGSAGPGERGGMGDKCCGGVGDGERGPGFGPGWDGSWGGETPRAGRSGTTYPVCMYCPNPEFTDEARKAKHQGIVRLAVVVDESGRAAAVRVVQGLGMGLDERAVEAVRGWRFHPAAGPDRRPAKTWIIVEVVFRLL